MTLFAAASRAQQIPPTSPNEAPQSTPRPDIPDSLPPPIMPPPTENPVPVKEPPTVSPPMFCGLTTEQCA